jgi:hypothetical protein
MAERTIDGHVSNTYVAKCEGRVLNNDWRADERVR